MADEDKSIGLWGDAWRRLRKNPSAMAGLIIVVLILLIAIFAPFISPHDPNHQYMNRGLTAMGSPVGPSAFFPLGTDQNGRDMLSRLFYGARVSLTIGLVASFFNALVGIIVGLTAGYFGKWVDAIMMRFTDIVLAFPFLLFMIALLAVLSPGMTSIILAFVVVGWANFARLVRGQVLMVKEMEYIQAARALGSSTPRIIFRHVLPNVIAPIIALFALVVSGNIILEATVSFLGLGIQQPTPAWGSMIEVGATWMNSAPWLVIYPGLMLLITVMGFNLLGDGLRDALDPHLRR
ncbi:MAG: ABC transporter permease [Peptococcaceae bacterium]|nr:ABC transporter permease [Peptococcaceae bacterium]